MEWLQLQCMSAIIILIQIVLDCTWWHIWSNKPKTFGSYPCQKRKFKFLWLYDMKKVAIDIKWLQLLWDWSDRPNLELWQPHSAHCSPRQQRNECPSDQPNPDAMQKLLLNVLWNSQVASFYQQTAFIFWSLQRFHNLAIWPVLFYRKKSFYFCAAATPSSF